MEPSLQILVVEDERAHAELIRRAFAAQAASMELNFAENIQQALACLARAVPDLVVSDMLLPDGQGTDLLPKEGEPRFPLVLMTSFGNERMAVESIKAGAVNYVVKSVAAMNDLPRIAEHALREWQHITTRRLAEEELRRVNAVQSLILENSTVGISFVRNRVFEWVNARMAEILGLKRDDLEGASTRITFASEEEFQRIGDTAYPSLARGERFEDEIRSKRADGSIFWARIMGKALPGHPQEGTIWIFEDISDRKRIEEALKNHQEHLEELVALRTIELKQANERLQDLNEQKNCYFGVVAHDLRSPLNAIALGSELIRQESDPEKMQQVASKIRQEALDMSALIGHFLDIEAIESGNFHTEFVPFSLWEMAERAVGRHTLRAQEKGIDLQLHFSEGRWEVIADPELALGVLDNLISNAVKFSPMNSTVIVEGVHQGETLRVSVIDQGPGLTHEDLTRLFGRFARLSAKPTGGEHSVGLGLSVVKYMIDTMKGRIWVDSQPGQGAAFRFELPASP